MKIEAGKYYKTRDGRKVGPMKSWSLGVWHFNSQDSPQSEGLWLDDGTAKYPGAEDSPDLISEWKDESPSPIRTVTRREIVPGNYGVVAITKSNKVMIPAGDYTAEELREAANLLNQIAEVLQENGE